MTPPQCGDLPSDTHRRATPRELLESIFATQQGQRDLCKGCQEVIHGMLEALHGQDGVISRMAVLEEKAREVGKIRDRAFLTAKDAFVAALSASVTAAAMYLFQLL
jgi:hypothetical protein